jgi:TolB protein
VSRALSTLLIAFVALGPAAAPPREIVYVSNSKLWVIREDGTGKHRLTRSARRESQPEYSPDGKRIAFVSRVGTNEEVFVMNADGMGVRRLTNARGSDGQPTWSPDGKRIAFTSNRSGNWKIYVMNADGTRVRLITRTPRWVGDDAPSWSPNGRWIAFHSTRVKDGNGEVFRMRPDGSAVQRLTFTDCRQEVCADDSFPAWSLDGRLIVYSSQHGYASQRPGQSHDLWVMRPDGGGGRQITSTPGFDDWRARWSADRTKIVFWAVGRSFKSVYVVNPDASRLRLVTAGSYPVWRP